MGQEGVLLSLVEAVDLVHEQDGPFPEAPGAPSLLHHLPDLPDAAGHRRKIHKAAVGPAGDDPRQGGLAHPGRPPEHHAGHPVLLDEAPEDLSRPQQVLLPEKAVQIRRPHPRRQGFGSRGIEQPGLFHAFPPPAGNQRDKTEAADENDAAFSVRSPPRRVKKWERACAPLPLDQIMRRSILALPSGFRLLLALYAGLLVVFPLPDFSQNTGPGALPFEPFQRAFQRLVFLDANLRHLFFPPFAISPATTAVFTAVATVEVLYRRQAGASTLFEGPIVNKQGTRGGFFPSPEGFKAPIFIHF